MISFVLKVVVWSGVAGLLGWAAALVGPESLRAGVHEETSRLRSAFREPSVVAEFLRSARAASFGSENLLPPFATAAVRGRVSGGVGVVRIRAGIMKEALPILVAAFAAAVFLGLARREGLRSGPAFASPTQAYLGKHLAVAAAVYLVTFALVPLPLPPASVWWGAGGAAAGVYFFVGNLPLKV